MPDQDMRPDECAAYLKIPESALEQFVQEAGLPAKRLKSGELVFRRCQIDWWLGRSTKKGSPG